MAADSYEDARVIAAAASPNQFILQPYTGTTNDLPYLRNWVLNHVTTIYGVSADVFDTATVTSTSLLRDFVHRALYQVAASGAPASVPPNDISIISTTPQFLAWEDVALGFRYPAYGLCGFMAWQMWEVYRAFGYQTNEISTFNNAFGLSTDSHVMAQVYVSDLDKYIVQDPTFNFVWRDADETILSFHEAQREIHNGGGTTIDGFTNYRWYYYDGAPEAQLRDGMEEYIEANYLDVIYWWWNADGVRHQLLTAIFIDSDTAHDPGSDQGARFANEVAATNHIEQLLAQSLAWTAIAQGLRNDGYYVSGFAFADAAGNRTSEWITVRLSDGSYISIELQSETVLNGSYDQLMSEATGGTVLNPGTDLTGFLNPFYMLAVDGTLMNAGVAPPVPNDVIGDDNANQLIGTAGIDRLIGGGGDDLLDGQGGADFQAGGPGNDSYFAYAAGTLIAEKPGEGMDTIFALVDFQMPIHTEILNLHGVALLGIGNAGDNWIYGNATDNTLNGNGGIDRLLGGLGNDTYYVHSALDTIFESVGEGYDNVITNVSYTLTPSSEVELLKTYGTITSNPINLTGNEFNNALHGNSGANVLNGGSGADAMYGFSGNDTYWIDNPGDAIGFEGVSDGNDSAIVTTAMSWTLAAGVHVETIRTLGSATTYAVNLTGNELANTVVGNSASNQLNGGAGADAMWGYGGNDTYFVDNSGDRVVEAIGGGNDTVVTNTTFQLQAGSEVELLRTYGSSTTNAINLWGNEVINTLWGNSGNNVLSGGMGNDTLVSYGGSDIFYFHSPAEGGDQVLDFDPVNDAFYFNGAAFGVGAGTLLQADVDFVAGTAATTTSASFVYNGALGQLFWDADGTTSNDVTLIATLTTKPSLTDADFFFV